VVSCWGRRPLALLLVVRSDAHQQCHHHSAGQRDPSMPPQPRNVSDAEGCMSSDDSPPLSVRLAGCCQCQYTHLCQLLRVANSDSCVEQERREPGRWRVACMIVWLVRLGVLSGMLASRTSAVSTSHRRHTCVHRRTAGRYQMCNMLVLNRSTHAPCRSCL